MSSLYSKLSVLKDDADFFLNSRTNKTIKEIQKELNMKNYFVIFNSMSCFFKSFNN